MKLSRNLLLSIPLAVASLTSCVHAQPSSEDGADSYAQAGQQALSAGHYEVAERNFVALAKLEPGIAEVHATLGLIYFQEKKFDEAIVQIRQAQSLKPGMTRLDSLLAMSLSEVGKYGDALPGLERAFKQSTDPAVRRMCGLQLIRAYTGQQKDEKAVETALQMDQLYPKDPEVLYYTGKVYGNYAFLTIQKLAKDAPGSVWRHLAAAEAFESQGSNNEAIAEYREVLSLDPRRAGIHYRIGRTLLTRYHHQSNAQADLDEARGEFEQELQLNPHNGNAAYEVAEMHRQAGQLVEAAQLFYRALEDYPDFEEADVGLAAVLVAEKKPEEALARLHAALALNAEDEVAWYRLSQAEKALGHVSEQRKALAEFQRVHEKRGQPSASAAMTSSGEVTRQEVGAGEKP